MATTYTRYEDFLREAEAQAKAAQTAYATERKKRAEETVAALTSAAARSQMALQQRYQNQREQTENDYRAAYDANAVGERIARLNVAEALANMGLTDSGLNRSQQTAISSARMRADAQTDLQKQSALDKLLISLNEALAKSEQERVGQVNDVLTAAANDTEKNAQALYQNATDRAKTQFNADAAYTDAQLELEKARQEQALKQYTAEAQLQLQREKAAAQQSVEQKKLSATLAKVGLSSESKALQDEKTHNSIRATNLEILQDLLERRSNIFNKEWRATYDILIDYYTNLITNS